MAGVYDPLGFAAPLVVKAKIKLRELDTRGLSCHVLIDPEEKDWWKSWFQAIKVLNEIALPRCLFPKTDGIIRSELHSFTDASEEAYAAVIYLRNVYLDGKVNLRVLMAKTKLAPKKTISIPKLELNGYLLGARLLKYVGEALSQPITRRFLWTDSSTVRNWVRSPATIYKPFVSHRIGEIQMLTVPEEFRFVPGKLNPSDAATRSSLDVENGGISSAWLGGPEFLLLPEEKWPVDIPWIKVSEEIRSSKVNHVKGQQPAAEFSSLVIEPEDLDTVKLLDGKFFALIQRCQQECYPEEIDRLKRGKQLVKSTSAILSLSPFLDSNGLLRVGGRIRRVALPYENIHPIILPPKHPLTVQLIDAYHRRYLHSGTDFILSQIRHHFWIVHGREAVKQARSRCRSCLCERARPATQLMGELPDRVGCDHEIIDRDHDHRSSQENRSRSDHDRDR